MGGSADAFGPSDDMAGQGIRYNACAVHGEIPVLRELPMTRKHRQALALFNMSHFMARAGVHVVNLHT